MIQSKIAYVLIIVSAFLDSLAAYIVKTQFNKLGPIDFSSIHHVLTYLYTFFKNPVLIIGVMAFVMAPGIWFLALNRLELSVGYPVLVGFHLLFVMILGLAFLGEQFTLNKMLATLLIGLSVWILYK